MKLRLLRALWPSMATLYERARDVVELHRAQRVHPRQQANALTELMAAFDVVDREGDAR